MYDNLLRQPLPWSCQTAAELSVFIVHFKHLNAWNTLTIGAVYCGARYRTASKARGVTRECIVATAPDLINLHR